MDTLPTDSRPLTSAGWLKRCPLPRKAVDHLFEGNKIRAIKAYRDVYRRKFPTRDPEERSTCIIGLKEAKDAVEYFADLIGPMTMDKEQCDVCEGLGFVKVRRVLDCSPIEYQRRLKAAEEKENVPF